MAYKAEASYESIDFYAPASNHYWAITESVGWGNYNIKDDVMLVQYLINKCAGKKVLETDGLFGNKTFKAIKNFQRSVNDTGYSFCRVDGRVSNVMGKPNIAVESGDFYTIHQLNWFFIQEKRIYFNDIRADPDLPIDLCSSII